MSFMDDKKEVMNIELTQYGRYLLSKGDFKPEFYSFFDEDVVYDLSFVGVEETQSEATERIFDHSVILKPQRVIPETQLAETDIFKNTLGSSEAANQLKPAWNINTNSTKISSITNNVNAGQKVIVQLENKIINYYRSDLTDTKNMEVMSSLIEDGNRSYFYAIEDPSIIIELSEENVDNLKNNFDLELFSIDGQGNYNKYEFIKPATNIRNGILYDTIIEGTEELDIYTDETTAETYFIVEVDSEITEINTRETQTTSYAQRISNGEEC
jgi:hypothetical protein